MAITWKKLAYEEDVVTKALFDADTFLYATDDNTPVATSPANVLSALSGHAGAEFLFNTQKIGGLVDPTTNQQAATKKYVDDQIAVDEFTDLTDTPAAYDGEGGKLVAVNAAPDALEFVPITDFLEGVPTEDLASKAPTSEWAFDHDADVDGHHDQLHAASHKNAGSDEILLDELGEPTGAVDFDLQEATDLVVMTVANEAALPGANVALGQLCWATSELSLHACVSDS